VRSFSVTHLRERGRAAFWLVPAGCVLVALALALALPRVNVQTRSALLFPGGPESARSFLSSITTAMISVTGVVFSITIVALQLAAGQFSSRVMRDFLRDRTIQFTFGVFVATFTYAMVLQRSVRGVTGSSDSVVPQLAVTVAFGFRELVDIAERALSPAVNDPTTAAQAIDVMHDLLRRLATRATPTGRHLDPEGRLRLIVPVYSFRAMLALALDEIEHYGASDVQVPRRLRAMLIDLADVALPAYRSVLNQRLNSLALQARCTYPRDVATAVASEHATRSRDRPPEPPS
jgi:uncharacterized membrane protein